MQKWKKNAVVYKTRGITIGFRESLMILYMAFLRP